MISIDQPVRLDKLSAHRAPAGMLPTGYWLKGKLLQPPKVGETLLVLRYERAAQTPEETTPVRCMGHYMSSPVQSLVENEDGSVTATTMNSAWRIVQIEKDA